ncbi:hypothetical protein M2360_003685 [Rhizobium sp. SG_E_25_P2]|uniref:hypothetical protein n=1 Tax=Rhizobium sp. SG_E_25_P2 TaxID=2879942 RepID=UPI002473B965|nr:hypothetical protein [Rhizobium sp. SG_E_25_P2]MDH6268280.1 hypothetical protein [Rhizobium sp. SG_E_25_P2]
MTYALHSPSSAAGRAGYLVAARQHWEHFEYVTTWANARHFNSIDEAAFAATSSRHHVVPISERDWRDLHSI